MQVIVATAGVVFLAELGDKTQLVALGLGARHRLAPVVAGVVAAYLATTTVSVVVGGVLGAALPTDVIGVVGGLLFLAFAVLTFRRGEDPADTDTGSGADSTQQASSWSILASVAGAMFIAELGDKTMLATATLAARDDAVLVGIGAAIGITAAGLLGVVIGRAVGARLPEQTIRIGSAALFAVFGIVLIVTGLS